MGTGYSSNYRLDSVGVSVARVAVPCATCGGPKAIGGMAEAECPDCRIRRGLVAAAAEAGVAAQAFAAAVRTGRPLVRDEDACAACGRGRAIDGVLCASCREDVRRAFAGTGAAA